MEARGPSGAADGRASRLSAIGFGAFGAVLVLAGVISIATGIPNQAHNMAPLAGPADIGRRLGEISPLIAASLAALVVALVVLTLAMRRLSRDAAAAELIVLGVAIEICVIGAIGRIGYAPNGSVLFAGLACITGGASVIAAGVIAALVHE